MKRNSLITALFFLGGIAYAQDVTYKKVYDDPNKIAPLNIQVEPMFLDLYGASTTYANAGAGIGARFMFKNVATLEAATRVSILGVGQFEGANYSMKEFVGTYHLRDRTVDANLPVTLSSSSTTYTTTTKYFRVPAKKRSIIGLRLGFYNAFTYVDKDYKKLKSAFGEKTETGALPDYENGLSTHLPPFSAVGMHTNVLSLGIAKMSITNLKVNVDGYRLAKKHKRENDLYLDLLFGLNTKFENQTAEDGTVWQMSNEKLSRIGFKAGYLMKRGIFTYKVEMASRPGVKGGNFSFLQGFVFNIPVRFGSKPTNVE